MSTPDPAPAVPTTLAPNRLTSLDAYRGFVMLLMMGEVLRFCDVAGKLDEGGHGGLWAGLWAFLCRQQSHVDWVGCVLHDMIQPSFSFLVGVALPFSIAARVARGQGTVPMAGHAVLRAVLLTLLGVFLRSTHASQTNWTFEDTLSQIGLGYVFLFLLGLRPVRDQWIGLGVILVGYWAAFALWPLPGTDFDHGKVGVSAAWLKEHGHTGFAAHWQKNSNIAWAFDTWFLNLFSRAKPWLYNGGGYSTISFIPTLGTMVLGLIAGGVLRSERDGRAKLKWLATAGVVCLASGWALGALGICPVVKKIWTPSWVLFSGGGCCLLLAGFHALVDFHGWKRWAFPLVVVGTNSIAAYSIAHLWDGFIAKNLKTHLGQGFFGFAGAYEPFVFGATVLLVEWAILHWMWRRKIFLRL